MADTIHPYGCRQAFIFPISDLATPTYDTGVEIPCPQKVMFPKRINEILVKGGDSICFASADLEGFDITITSGAVALDLEEILYGHAHTEVAGPPEYEQVEWTTDDVPGVWGLILKVNSKQPGGTILVAFHRCSVTSAGGYSGAEGDTPGSAEYSAIGYASPEDGSTFGRARFYKGTSQTIDTDWTNNDIVTI